MAPEKSGPSLFFGSGFLRFFRLFRLFRLMMFEMLEQGLYTMFDIDKSRSDMDFVQIREKVSYFFEDAHNCMG